MLMAILQYGGACAGILGAGLLATNTRYSRFGWLFFLVSNVFWIGYSAMTGTYGLLWQQIAFTVTSLIGMQRWFAGTASKEENDDSHSVQNNCARG